MKDTTKRLLLIIVPVILIVSAVGGGCYLYYSYANRKAAEGKADKDFRDTYNRYVSPAVSPVLGFPDPEEINGLDRQFDQLRAQRDSANARKDDQEVLRLTNEVESVLSKRAAYYGKELSGFSRQYAIVSGLYQKAQKLSDRKRRIAMNLTSKARKKCELGKEIVYLQFEGIVYNSRIDAAYIGLAQGQKTLSQFDEEINEVRSRLDENHTRISEKAKQLNRKDSEVKGEWGKLKPLLGS